MAVGGGGNKVAAAYARRGSFLRTGIQSGVLAGQGGKSSRQGLPTVTPRSRRNGKTRQGPAGDLPNGPLKLVAEKREKAGESQVLGHEKWGPVRKLGALRKSAVNSATAVKPWRTRCPRASSRPSGALQFGHGGEAVEDCKVHESCYVQPTLQF